MSSTSSSSSSSAGSGSSVEAKEYEWLNRLTAAAERAARSYAGRKAAERSYKAYGRGRVKVCLRAAFERWPTVCDFTSTDFEDPETISKIVSMYRPQTQATLHFIRFRVDDKGGKDCFHLYADVSRGVAVVTDDKFQSVSSTIHHQAALLCDGLSEEAFAKDDAAIFRPDEDTIGPGYKRYSVDYSDVAVSIVALLIAGYDRDRAKCLVDGTQPELAIAFRDAMHETFNTAWDRVVKEKATVQ